MEEKQLPQSAEAEAGVLGSILIDPDALSSVVTILAPADFYGEARRKIYAAAIDLYNAGTVPDLITLGDELQRRGELEEMGGIGYVSSLANQVPSHKNVTHYARIVGRCAILRRLIHAAGQIAGVAYNDADEDTALEEAEQQIARIRQTRPAAKDGPRFLDDDDLDAVPPARGILGNILFEQSFAILYGPSGRWKSFLALSWALSIATGRPWLGHHVAEGDVFYVAAEGGLGIRNRVRAWKRRHGVTQTRMRTLLAPLNLLDPAGVRWLIGEIKAKSEAPAVVVIDTLSRCMPGGDENGGKDGSAAVAAVDAIRAALGCTVLVVAHPGKDEARGIRGWSGYFAAADTVIRVAGGGNEARIEPGTPITVSCDKPKDSEPFRTLTLTTEIERWATEEGAIESSLVIVPCDAASASNDLEITPNRQAVLDALRDLQAANGGERVRPMDLEQALEGKLKKPRIYEALTALVAGAKVDKDETDTRRPTYAIVENGTDGTVGTVRSKFGTDVPGNDGTVRYGVSIDTVPPYQAPDLAGSGRRPASIADVEIRPGEKVATYSDRLAAFGFDASDTAAMYYTPSSRLDIVARHNRKTASAS